MFERLHSEHEYGGGSGSGLALVNRIIDRHSGKIWVESVPGQGTTFFFTLEPELGR
jgi:signal transduction histidine kinase